ncbi:MAG: ATP-binding protein [Pseudomonadota bacterium]
MFNRFIKPWLPRSLFGRALMILIVPIVLIQVVVGVVFVERLFQDVTRQMTRAAAIDIAYVLRGLEGGEDMAARARALKIGLARREPGRPTPTDRHRDIIDFSGTYIIETLRDLLPGTVAVDLGAGRNTVVLTLQTGAGLMDFTFSRRRVAAANPHQLLVYMVATSALMALVAVLFMRNQVLPIRRLARAAEAFGKGQTLPVTLRGAAEVRAATQAFSSMRARIERHIEQRTLMLSGVSHDLRTPLTRLRLSLSLADPGEETAFMARDLDEMEAILDEFLAFARGDSGEEPVLVPAGSFAEGLVNDARRQGQKVELSFQGDPGVAPTLTLRRTVVARALSNLLSNARRYSQNTRMSVYLGTGFVEFVVEDDGPGIDPGARETALKPFVRLDTARNQDAGSGAGLGLAIAADAARSHGGDLTLGHSTDLGGLRAVMRLPR